MKLIPTTTLLNLAIVSPALAGFTVFEQNFTGWIGASGTLTTITFMGLADGTPVTEQYS